MAVEDVVPGAGATCEEVAPRLEAALRGALGADGFLADVVEVSVSDVDDKGGVAPWNHFSYRLFRSPAATAALRALLRCTLPGTSSTFEDVFAAVATGGPSPGAPRPKHHCYLIGGQVRDVLRGKLSSDVDFNYSCTAQEVALVAVARGWPTKFKCIGHGAGGGAGATVPNYVLIGDESSPIYMEGFCIDFHATCASYVNDVSMNTLIYDLSNDLIIDKTGRGVSDVRQNALRLPLAAGETFANWSSHCFTPGGEELRYLKFLLRAEAMGQPLTYDDAECAQVVASLRDALSTNADALGGFYLGYTLKAQMQDAKGVASLRAWVERHGGPAWWEEQWEPLVRRCAAPAALGEADGPAGAVALEDFHPAAGSAAAASATATSTTPKLAWEGPPRRRSSWLSLRCLKFRAPRQVTPVDETAPP